MNVMTERGFARRRCIDATATIALWTAALAVIAMLLLFVGYLLYLGAGSVSRHFLTGFPSELPAGGGVGPEIFTSFYILFLTLFFTLPVALAAGIYMQEYASTGWFRALVQFSAESLATVPSIVMGLF